MNVSPKRTRSWHILFVSCVDSSIDLKERVTASGMKFDVVHTQSEFSQKLLKQQFDCVIVLIDPSAEMSIDRLNFIRHAAVLRGVPLASMSTFNPQWIENLMRQLGIERHFREFPRQSEIVGFLLEHSSYSQSKGNENDNYF